MLKLEDIAVRLDVLNKYGEKIHTYVIIHHDELINTTLGRRIESTNEIKETINLLKKSIMFSIGSPYDIYWYVVDDVTQIDYNDVSEIAFQNKASIVIIDSTN
jgi:hypothetical protein